MLYPNKTPIFNDSLRRISAEEFPKYMMSNQYVPQPYLDAQKNIKAFVLRKATSEELQMMARFQEQGPGMDSEVSALIGQKVKDFELKDIKGKELSLGLDSVYGIKKPESFDSGFPCSGDRTRTCGLRVMSPTSYQLLHPAIYLETCCFPYWDYKDTNFFGFCK